MRTSTAPVFLPGAYPHIVEEVLSYCKPAQLYDLRATCGYLYDLVDKFLVSNRHIDIVEHCNVETGQLSVEVWRHRSKNLKACRLPAFSSCQTIDQRSKRLLERVRFIDLDGVEVNPYIHRILHLVKNVEAIRLRRSRSSRSPPDLWRIVPVAPKTVVSCTRVLPEFTHAASQAVTRIVLNRNIAKDESWSSWFPKIQFPNVKEVVIFQDSMQWCRHPRLWSISQSIDRLHGLHHSDLVAIISHVAIDRGFTTEIKTTVVFDKVYHSEGQITPAEVLKDAKANIQEELPLAREKNIDKALSNVEFISSSEYRNRIGADQFTLLSFSRHL